MNYDKCAICGETGVEDKHYWINHKIKQSKYFEKYYPQYDLLTKELIPFKSKEQYQSGPEFINKNNLKKYLKGLPKEEAGNYCKNWLIKRKEQKNLKYSLSQFELRSLMSPAIPYLDEVLSDYYGFCKEIGLINKFDRLDNLIELKEIDTKHKIIIDSREQKALKFPISTEVKGLPYGDYFCETAPFKIAIERKGLVDAISTLAGGYDRFRRELDRAKEDNAYVIVLIEEQYSNLIAFNMLPWVSKKIKFTPEFVMRNARTIIQDYPNVQFLAVKNRNEATSIILKVFFSRLDLSKYDLQLAYDLKFLI